MFQSTRPCGARQPSETIQFVIASVSIHAPLRGATNYSHKRIYSVKRFNPRAPAGRDTYNHTYHL